MRLWRRGVIPVVLASAALSAGAQPAHAQVTPTVMDGDGMWIWVVAKSSGGDVRRMVAKAHRYGIENIVIKGSDGRRVWRQFSPWLVSTLKAAGLHVCAYQFVYGRRPAGEADAGVRLARRGADCLLIDAEGDYEGRYWQAQRYIRRLRSRLGQDYPLALAGFPYVSFHPGYPYSVFLGPGGAQLNVPQVYWKAIGTSVDHALSVTYRYNSLYQRPILPLGELWEHPRNGEVYRFRRLSAAYGARGVSWWDWQEASRRGWHAVGAPLVFDLPKPTVRFPLLRRGMRGDLVVWAQEHLRAAGEPVRVDGVFGSRMLSALVNFQNLSGLFPPGRIGPRTWQALLAYTPARVSWTRRGHARVSAASAGRSAPLSAHLPAVRNEIGHHPH